MPDGGAHDQWRRFAWDCAAALGVSASTSREVHGVIDPEALLLLVMQVDDPRLVGETLDWSIRHAPLLMPSRLRRMADECGHREVAEMWIATIDAHAHAVRWNHRAPSIDGFEPSGRSRGYDPASPSVAGLRNRALGGPTARSELLRALHPVTRGLQPAIERTRLVHDAAIARGHVPGLLDELDSAGLVTRSGTQRRQLIAPRLGSAPDIADSYWAWWRSLPWAPWRVVPRAACSLIAVDQDPPNGGPRDWAISTIAAARDELDALTMRGMPAMPRQRGGVLDVHDATRRQARVASRWLIDQLRAGGHVV